jgi:hypothetical protein
MFYSENNCVASNTNSSYQKNIAFVITVIVLTELCGGVIITQRDGVFEKMGTVK